MQNSFTIASGFYKYTCTMIAYTFLPEKEEGVFVCLFD